MALFNNKILTLLTLLAQVIQVLGGPSYQWMGGHVDAAEAQSLGGVLTDLGQQVGPCGCYGVATTHIKSMWQTSGYLADDLFLLLSYGVYSDSITPDLSDCQVYHFTYDQINGMQINDELPVHDHALPAYRVFVSFDGTGGITLGAGNTNIDRRLLESIIEEDFEEGFLQKPRRQLPPAGADVQGVTCTEGPDPPPNCDSALTPVTGWSSICLQENLGNMILNQNGFSDLFTHNSSINIEVDCPVSSCELFQDAACSVAADPAIFTLDALYKITIDTSTGNTLVNMDLCVKCLIGTYEFTNNFDSKPLTIDNILSLKVPNQQPADFTADYDGSTTQYTAVTTFQEFFDYQHETQCMDALECYLFNPDNLYLGGPEVYWINSYPFTINFDSNIVPGYTYDLKIRCYQQVRLGTSTQITRAAISNLWTLTLNGLDCSGVFTYQNGPAETADSGTLLWDTTTTNQVIRPITSSWTSWDDYFGNTDQANCPITSCSLYEAGCSTLLTSPVAISSASPWEVTAQKDQIAGYSKNMCIKCTGTNANGQETVQKDNWSVSQSQSTCQNVMSSPLAVAEQLTVAFSLTTTPEEVKPTSTFTSWDDYFGATSNCPIISCSLLNQGCTGSMNDEISMDISSPWAVFASKDYTMGYDEIVCVQCTNGAETIQKDNWSIAQAADCTNVLTQNAGVQFPNVLFDYDLSSSTSFDVSAQFPSIYNSGTQTIDWDTHFQNTNIAKCPITDCWLMTNDGSSNLTLPISMEQPSKRIFANHQAGGTYSEYYSVYCNNNEQQVVDDRFKVVQEIDCTGTLQDQTSTAMTLQYMDGAYNSALGFWQENLVPPGALSFTDWRAFFSNSEPTDCPVECEVFDAGCTSAIAAYLSYDLSDNQIYVQTDTDTLLNFDICLKCTTIQGDNDAANLDEAKLDNWAITVNGCAESLITPTNSPQVINLIFEPGSSDVQIFPDSSNSTWKDYFLSNSQCDFNVCELFVGGTCDSGVFTAYTDNVYMSLLNNNVYAKTSIDTGYQINVCVGCSLTTYTNPPSTYWDNWLVNLIAYDCEIQPVSTSTIFLDIGQNFDTQLSSLFEIVGQDEAQESCQTLTGALSPISMGMSISGQEISFDTSQPSLYEKSATLTVSDQISNSASTVITYFVCGNEQVNLTSNETLVKTFSLNSGSNLQQILVLSGYKEKFESSKLGCNVTRYRLIEFLSTGEAVELLDDQVSMNSDFEILVNTSQSMSKTLLVEATTDNSNSSAILEVIIYVTNFAPYFKDGPPEPQVFQFSSVNTSFTYVIPEIIDLEELEGGIITVQVSNLDTSFMVYDQELNEIHFEGITNETNGNYTVQITLIDSQAKSSSYEVTFEILPQIQDQQSSSEEEQIDDEEEEEEEEDEAAIIPEIDDQSSFEDSTFKFQFAITINQTEDETEEEIRLPINIEDTEFTQDAKVTLDFSEDLFPIDHFFQANTTLEMINENITRLIEITYYSQVEAEADEDDLAKGLDLKVPVLESYKIDSFTERYVKLKLKFTNPLYVSSKPQKDYISVKFITNQLFVSKTDYVTLAENYTIESVTVPAQIPSQEEFELVKTITNTASNGLMVSFLIPFLFMIFARFSMNRVWALYYMLQMMSNLVNFLVLLIPANSLMVLDTIKNVTNFRLFKDPTVQRLVKQYVFRGKADWLKNVLIDEGADITSQIIFFLIFGLVIIFSRVQYVKEYCEDKKKEMMWSGWLRGKITCYFPTCILVCTQVNHILGYKSGLEITPINENPSTLDYIRCFFKLFILIMLPIYSYIHLRRNSESLKEEEFDQKYGTLYLNLNKNKAQTLTYSSFFCLKRLLIGAATVYLNNSVVANAFINIFSNLAFIKYLADSMPMEFSFLNQLELMNEVTMLFFNYFFFLFTDFLGTPELRYEVGKYFIYLTIFVICVNFALISAAMFTDARYDYRVKKAKGAWKEYRKLKAQMARYIMRERDEEFIKGLLGKDFTLSKKRQQKKFLQKFTYKEMEQQILEIMNAKETVKPNIFQKAIYSMLQLNVLSLARKSQTDNVDQIEETPRFGAVRLPPVPENNSSSSSSDSSNSSFPSDFTIDQDFVNAQILKVTLDVQKKRVSILEPESDNDSQWDKYDALHRDVQRDQTLKMSALIQQQTLIRSYQKKRSALKNEESPIKNIERDQIDRRFIKTRT